MKNTITSGNLNVENFRKQVAGKEVNLFILKNNTGMEVSAINFGAICGCTAGRIAGSRFKLNGKEYRLATNNGTKQFAWRNQKFQCRSLGCRTNG